MNKKSRMIYLLILLLCIPLLVNADSFGNSFSDIFGVIFMEAFVSIHMSFFVLIPLAKMFFKENYKKGFWTLFAIRAGILLFCDFFVTPGVAIIDFFAVFVGAFLVVPICSVITRNGKRYISGELNKYNDTIPTNIPNITENRTISGVKLKCAKCQSDVLVSDKFCPNCGVTLEGDNLQVVPSAEGTIEVPKKEIVSKASFDSIYNLSEDSLLEEFINREFNKVGIEKSTKLVPESILKKKMIFNIIFSILLFVYLCLIFIHFPIYTYVIGFIILLIFFIATRRYNLMKYLKKEIKSRPSEKISNIVMNVKTSFVEDNTRTLLFGLIIIAISLSMIIFSKPRILYEKVNGGYAVRYYAFGLTEFKTATIPDTYKGEKVVALRGNAFSNMPFLEEVKLPNTIKEIRGQAFLNDRKLVKVNIPRYLEYLGGGAFYNCTSITSIELPDTLSYLGGEAFYGASNLRTIKLSENLEEIRGDTFEYCDSLESITIPDKVTRIGGHAFYGDSSLREVKLTENSKLAEIGSSAFRRCYNLSEITIPRNTYVNERAFKESPTSIRYFGDTPVDTSNIDRDLFNTFDIFYNSSEGEYNEAMTDAKSNNLNTYLFMSGEKVLYEKYSLIVSVKDHEYGVYEIKVIAPKIRTGILSFDSNAKNNNYFFFEGNKIEYTVDQETNRLRVTIQNKDELKAKYSKSKELLINPGMWQSLDSNTSYSIRLDDYNYNLDRKFFFTINSEIYNNTQFTISRKEKIRTIDDDLMIELISDNDFNYDYTKIIVYYN